MASDVPNMAGDVQIGLVISGIGPKHLVSFRILQNYVRNVARIIGYRCNSVPGHIMHITDVTGPIPDIAGPILDISFLPLVMIWTPLCHIRNDARKN